jgi:hypothetical protein
MSNITNECRDNCSAYQSIGTFNRLNYDNCAYDKKLKESTTPLSYHMSRFKFENCARCTYDGKQYAPFDLVEEESELRGIVRPSTKCPTKLYHPNCQKSNTCQSTYDKDVPIIYPPNLCPVVSNNIKKMNNPGYSLQRRNFCDNLSQNQSNQINQRNQQNLINPPNQYCAEEIRSDMDLLYQAQMMQNNKY